MDIAHKGPRASLSHTPSRTLFSCKQGYNSFSVTLIILLLCAIFYVIYKCDLYKKFTDRYSHRHTKQVKDPEKKCPYSF